MIVVIINLCGKIIVIIDSGIKYYHVKETIQIICNG